MENNKEFKEENNAYNKEEANEEMAKKCTIRKVKVKGHFRFNGLFPKYIRGYTKKVCLPVKKKKRKYNY